MRPDEMIVMRRTQGGGFYGGLSGQGMSGMSGLGCPSHQDGVGGLLALRFPLVPVLLGLAIGFFIWGRR